MIYSYTTLFVVSPPESARIKFVLYSSLFVLYWTGYNGRQTPADWCCAWRLWKGLVQRHFVPQSPRASRETTPLTMRRQVTVYTRRWVGVDLQSNIIFTLGFQCSLNPVLITDYITKFRPLLPLMKACNIHQWPCAVWFSVAGFTVPQC